MDTKTFDALIDEIRTASLDTLAAKNARYARGDDRLHNFRVGASLDGSTPAQACWGYLCKHLVALRDMVKRNDFTDREDLKEKCKDAINYICFIWCIGNDETRDEPAPDPEKTYRDVVAERAPDKVTVLYMGGVEGCPGRYLKGAPRDDTSSVTRWAATRAGISPTGARSGSMTERDPVKEFLRSALEAKLEAKRRSRRVKELESRCTKMTAAPDSGACGGGNADREVLWALLADERDKEEKALHEELAQYKAVEDFIARLDDPVHRAILRLRYLEGLGWVKLQQQLYRDGVYYSERHITRLHGAALEAARELWKRPGPWHNGGGETRCE